MKTEEKIIPDMSELTTMILQAMHPYDEIDDNTFKEIIADLINQSDKYSRLPLDDKRKLAVKLFNRMRRLDILQPLMDDESVTEIMVNGPSQIFYEKEGRLYPSSLHFDDSATLEQMILHFFSTANRPLNEAFPIADLRLPDGSRKVIAISEVLPLKNGEYQTSDLLVWKTDRIAPDGKVEGRFVLKNRPTFIEQAAIAQSQLPNYEQE